MNGVTVICQECSFDPASAADSELGKQFARYGDLVAGVITQATSDGRCPKLAARSTPIEWSTLEYSGHVAGVLETITDWARRSQLEDLSIAEGIDQDAEVVASGYNDVAPQVMVERLIAAAATAQGIFAPLSSADLDVPLAFSGMHVPLRILAIAMLHECHHHLGDIKRIVHSEAATSG